MTEQQKYFAEQFAGYLKRLGQSMLDNIDPEKNTVEITKELAEEIAQRITDISNTMIEWE